MNNDNFKVGKDKYYHFILLAKDAIGHQQIREISTRAWMRSYMARGMRRVPTYYQDLIDIIGQNPGHVIGSTACIGGALGTQLLIHKETEDNVLYHKIILWVNQMKEIFGKENFFLEMQPSHNKDQIYVNEEIIHLSEICDVSYIITNDSHYLIKEDLPIHEAFLNAQGGDREVKSFYATTYLMNDDEVREYMVHSDGVINEEILQKSYQNIVKIKDMCEDYSIMKPLKIPQLAWKDLDSYTLDQRKWVNYIPYLDEFWDSNYEGDQQLADIICLALEKDVRLQYQECYDEINECLKMTWISSEVNKTHWSAYFLNLQKIIEECWNAGTLVGCGRGSGVGFILLYLLGITQINPLWEKTKTERWRFLNPSRVSVLDVDVDIEGSRRQQVLEHLRKVYGYDRVANVLTLGTEKSKSAILTAARGLGIDVDIAQYLASMIQAPRGMLMSLKQTAYGDEENDIPPNMAFRHEMEDNYPELWKVAQRIEGLICRTGIHAGGIIFVDEPFTESTALMKAPDGTIITQFDLHDCEDVSLIKYDLLSVEALDKMHNCIDLICEHGYTENENTLKETYEKLIGIYNLERTEPKMWEMVWEHKIQSLFQMEKQSGIQGISLAKPQSVDDLATLNSVIRLMAQEKGAEQPLNKFARFKSDINEWYKEMKYYGLSQKEQELLKTLLSVSYGICESQEGFMQLVQMPECGGFNLTWADKLRKSIAKKNPKDFEKLQEEYFKVTEEKGLSKNLCNYVWNVLVSTSKGYGFNKSHTLAYSLIALQEMNLAYKYPIVFWNCACLISDSGGNEDEEDKIDEGVYGFSWDSSISVSVTDFNEEDEIDEETDDEAESDTQGSKKKTTRTANYGKIATAIGKMRESGITVSPPDINNSVFTFSPDPQNNIIRYGLSGITRIGESVIREIIENRPYESFDDFISKVKVNKTQVINLIKSGAFDSLGERIKIMNDYIHSISDTKNKLNLQNMKMLIEYDILPREELGFEIRVYNFNKYLKALAKIRGEKTNYYFDERAYEFYSKYYDLDILHFDNNEYYIAQNIWDKIYKKEMDPIRDYLKKHQEECLHNLNMKIINETWDKYAAGSISKWEMDSVSFYSHNHELAIVDNDKYDFDSFYDLPEEPEVERTIEIKGKEIPMFRLSRIAGTVLDKDKNKGTVTLLTVYGVVTVRIWQNQFVKYNKQISEKQADGKKKVIEKSWFSRGNKLAIVGIRRGDSFIPKIYKTSHWSEPINLIKSIDDFGNIEFQKDRIGEE